MTSPAPWTVAARGGNTLRVLDANGNNVALVDWHAKAWNALHVDADAALIATAPELLDALRRLMRHIPADWGGASLSDDMSRARAAVARATSLMLASGYDPHQSQHQDQEDDACRDDA